MDIEKILLKNQRYSAYYRTDTTRTLDEKFNLDGTPLTDSQLKKFQSLGMGTGQTESEMLLPYITWIAGKLGYFVGLPTTELCKALEGSHIRPSDVRATIREGLLQTYTYEEVEIVEPAPAYERFSAFGKVEREKE